MTSEIDEQYRGLLQLLTQAPVMGTFHPLLFLALPPDVVIANSAQEIAQAMDSLEPHPERPTLINEYDVRFEHRFLTYHCSGSPNMDEINHHIANRLFDPLPLLKHSGIRDRIRHDTLRRGYQLVILLLVDGLSYEDVRHWPEQTEPCLVDGPSITFATTEEDRVAADVGFARILGDPPLSQKLQTLGFHSRGYSYWDRKQNDVSAHLFRGMPLQRVRSIDDAISALDDLELNRLYIQIVREGTDGLAHRRREVRDSQVAATVEAIHEDLRAIIEVLRIKKVKSALYLTSDHGMLWKHEHDFDLMLSPSATSLRYTLEPPHEAEYVTDIEASGRTYYLYHYPYIGRRIRSNESGLHGGISYQESVVPFVHLEVN